MVKIDREGNLRGTVDSLFSSIPLLKRIKTNTPKSGDVIESGNSVFTVKRRLDQLILAQMPKEKHQKYSGTNLEKEISNVLKSQGFVEKKDFFPQHFPSGLKVYHPFDFWIPAFKLGIEPGAIYYHVQRIDEDRRVDMAVREIGGYILWYTEYEIENGVAKNEVVEVLNLLRENKVKSAAEIIDSRREMYFSMLKRAKEQKLL